MKLIKLRKSRIKRKKEKIHVAIFYKKNGMMKGTGWQKGAPNAGVKAWRQTIQFAGLYFQAERRVKQIRS